MFLLPLLLLSLPATVRLAAQTRFPLEPVLARARSFDLADEFTRWGLHGAKLTGMRSSGANLFFLAREGRGGNSSATSLVRTDLRGRIGHVERLGMVDVIDWRVFGDGTVTVALEPLAGGPKEMILTYSLDAAQ